MRNVLIFLFLYVSIASLSGQSIQLSFLPDAGKEYALYFHFGQKTDSVAGGFLDTRGNAILEIPASYSNYKGIARLQLGGKKGSGMPLIVNKENFAVSAIPDGLIFRNSNENDYLLNFFKGNVSPVIGDGLYAKRYLGLLQFKDELLRKNVPVYVSRTYIRNELDIEALYTSGLWNHIISATFGLYSDTKNFGYDMTEVLKRTKDKFVFEALGEDLVVICNQFGWENAQDTIVSYLINSKRIAAPSAKLYAAFEQFKVRPGVKAPALVTDAKRILPKKSLLVFYESGCENCDLQIKELINKYQDIKEKGYDVISVSSDIDKDIFLQDSKVFPWKIKLCDLEGFSGDNFINYGIIGTPTMYLIDNNGIVKGRFARLQDVVF